MKPVLEMHGDVALLRQPARTERNHRRFRADERRNGSDFGPLADDLLHLRHRLLRLRQRGVGVGLEVDFDDAGVHRRHEVAANQRHLAQREHQQNHRRRQKPATGA